MPYINRAGNEVKTYTIIKFKITHHKRYAHTNKIQSSNNNDNLCIIALIMKRYFDKQI